MLTTEAEVVCAADEAPTVADPDPAPQVATGPPGAVYVEILNPL